MAAGDFKVRYPGVDAFSFHRIVASGAVGTINPGEPTKQGTAGAVAIMADGDGTTSQVFTGIAKTLSTDTASAAGEIQLYFPLPGLVYSGKAKSAAAADTQAEIDALQGKRVVFDLTSGAWTVDSAASDATTNGLLIMGGDYRTSELFFVIRMNIALYNPTT